MRRSGLYLYSRLQPELERFLLLETAVHEGAASTKDYRPRLWDRPAEAGVFRATNAAMAAGNALEIGVLRYHPEVPRAHVSPRSKTAYAKPPMMIWQYFTRGELKLVLNAIRIEF